MPKFGKKQQETVTETAAAVAPAPEPQPEPITEAIQPEVLRAEISSLALPQAPPPEEVLKQASAQIAIFKGYMKLLAHEVRPEQVLLFGEHIYLPKEVCQRLMGFARLRLKIHHPIYQNLYKSPDGEFIVFEAHATICDSQGRELDDVVASASTRDDFFAMADKKYVCPECKMPTVKRRLHPSDKWDSPTCTNAQCKFNGTKVSSEQITSYLPLYDVPIESVLKKTVTNVFNRALQAIGMMPSLEDLKEAGMDISKVQRIGFNSSKKDQDAKPAPQQATQQHATQAQPATQATAATQTRSAAQPQAKAPEPLGHGKIEYIEYKTTKPNATTGKGGGNTYMSIKQGGNWLVLFQNHGLDMGNGKEVPVFDLLRDKVGWDCIFTVEMGKFATIVGASKLGPYEFDENGELITHQPSGPVREPGDDDIDGPQISDDDIPF